MNEKVLKASHTEVDESFRDLERVSTCLAALPPVTVTSSAASRYEVLFWANVICVEVITAACKSSIVVKAELKLEVWL